MISTVQKVIQDYNPEINVSVGSALYLLLCAPTAEVYTHINSKISELDANSSLLTATDKLPLISNFGIPSIEGKQGTGILKITTDESLPSYFIPANTEFTTSDGSSVLSVDDITFTGQYAYLNVITKTNTSRVYQVGTPFTTLVYGNIITSVVVTTEVNGGKDDEAESNYLSRVYESLYINPTTESGVKYLLNSKYNDIVDVKVTPDETNIIRYSGIGINILMKLPLVSKTVILEPPYILKDIVISSSQTIINKKYPLTAFESNQFNTSNVEYLSVNLKEKQSYIDSIMPIGINAIAVQAYPVFVSGNIYLYGSTPTVDLISFINNYKLETFYMNKILDLLDNYKLPVELSFNDTKVTNIYNSTKSAYYYKNIELIQ